MKDYYSCYQPPALFHLDISQQTLWIHIWKHKILSHLKALGKQYSTHLNEYSVPLKSVFKLI